MNLALKKVNISFDYITVAFICGAVILCKDSKYVIAFACTALHEMGHILVMLKCGCDRVDITVNLFNIAISDKQRGMRPYSQDIAIICAGPLVNLLTFAVFKLAYTLCPNDFLRNTAMISLALAIFNLLPMESTDGGQLVYILLCRKLSPRASQIIMTVVTVIILIPTACAGFFVLIRSKYNYTLLFAALYVVALILMKRSKYV